MLLYLVGTALGAIALVMVPKCAAPAGWVRPVSVDVLHWLAVIAMVVGWGLGTQGERWRWARLGFLWLVPLGIVSAVASLFVWACSMG
ncbi:hypothetical protein [Leeia aquatica]|uniref:hypothetical protein n=1 Tax=Leeia aquatica TaxID=2725557 RepID=UPI00198079C0|nr:hypothetical protein [Leeia aquatica]